MRPSMIKEAFSVLLFLRLISTTAFIFGLKWLVIFV
jgi:hypothetical protein